MCVNHKYMKTTTNQIHFFFPDEYEIGANQERKQF